MTLTPIPDCPGYFITESGQVYKVTTGGADFKRVKTRIASNGYWMVHMVDKNRKKVYKTIHRILALIHIPNPENKPQVSHVDGDRTNYKLTNLEWATQTENEAQKRTHGKIREGESHYASKLTKQDVLEIRKIYKCGAMSGRDLAKLYNIGFKNISAIVLRKTWKTV